MSVVNITSIFRKDVDTRFGIKPKVGIKTVEHGDKWLSTFKTKGTEDWTEGMQVEVNVSENGDFMNFNPVLGVTVHKAGIGSPLEERVKKLEVAVFGAKTSEVAKEADKADEKADEEIVEDELDTGF